MPENFIEAPPMMPPEEQDEYGPDDDEGPGVEPECGDYDD
jgi:hypothetical protein